MKKKLLTMCLVAALAATAVVGGTMAYFTDTTDDVENTFTMGKVDIDLDEALVGEDGKAVSVDRVKENNYSTVNLIPGRSFDKDPTIHVFEGSEDSYIFLDMTFNKYSSLFWVMAADASADTSINFTIFDKDGNLSDEYKNDSGVFSTTKFVKAMIANKEVFQQIINKWFVCIEHTDWELCDIFTGVKMNGKSDKYMTIRFAYQGDNDGTPNTVLAADGNIDIKFMNQFKMPGTVTQEMIEAGETVGGMENIFNTEKQNFNMIFKAYAIQAGEITDLDAAYEAMFGIEKGATLASD